MTKIPLRQRFSHLLRRHSWVVRLAYPIHLALQPRYTIGVVGIVFNAHQQVLLAEHLFHPEIPWGLPGGFLGHREDPSTGLQREFREELGLNIDIQHVLYTEYTHWNHIDIAFLCHPIGQIMHLSGELTDARWFKREDLPQITRFQYRALQHAYSYLQANTGGIS